MNSILTVLLAATVLSGTPASDGGVTVADATPLIRDEYKPLANLLSIRPAFCPTSGNTLEVMRVGTRYKETMTEDFDNAEKLIEIECLLFGDDHDGNEIKALLAEKVDEGVQVRYTHENFGNFFDSIFDGRQVMVGYYDDMSRIGIDKRDFGPLLRFWWTYLHAGQRNHRKINVIDEKIGYIGGMNITSGSLSAWGDAHVRVTGPGVYSLRSIFLQNWNAVGFDKRKEERFDLNISSDKPSADGKILQVVADGPDEPAHMAERALEWVLDNAKQYVYMETPYLVPTQRLLKALKRAAARGVDVRLVVPRVCDMEIVDPINHYYGEECAKAGIKFYFRRPPFNHSKVFVADGYLSCIGSSNLDKLSLKRLYEVNAYIYDEEIAGEILRGMQKAMENSDLMDAEHLVPWTSKEKFDMTLVKPFDFLL